MNDQPDTALLTAWRGGDGHAGAALVERHFDSLLRFFSVHVGDAAADLVQQTWAACVARRDDIDEQRSFPAFLFGVARKELLMHLRKRYRGERFAARAAAAQTADTSPSQALLRGEESSLLHWALRELPTDSRMILQLAYWEELSMAEIAAVLEIAAGTVKSRLFRARAHLRELMESSGAQPQLVDSAMRTLDRGE